MDSTRFLSKSTICNLKLYYSLSKQIEFKDSVVVRSAARFKPIYLFSPVLVLLYSLLLLSTYSLVQLSQAATTPSYASLDQVHHTRNLDQPSSAQSNLFKTPDHASSSHSSWRGLNSPTTPGTPNSSPTIAFSPVISSSANSSRQPYQARSLKFTLISGKYWKFNVKTNSLQTSHKERELRLHRNISVNNFIIDDDGWFQYNHQQQQLFAWPSLNTEPSTYYFVLLPSGLDYEADGENVINGGDVVANIVVELLPPLYLDSRGSNVDQLIDHKFSLEYLRRHQSYPLLLSQLVAIFETLSKNSTTSNGSLPQLGSSPASSTTITSTVSAASQQNKQTPLQRPLSEYLLIQSSATSDGELFSLTWTTIPGETITPITPIENCRLFAINDTISKLSSRSVLYPTADDKFVISYSLEGPLVSSNTIIPTERGNYALQLTLNKACRRQKIFEELGVSPVLGIYGFQPTVDIERKENTSTEDYLPDYNGTDESHEDGRNETRSGSIDRIKTSLKGVDDETSTNKGSAHLVNNTVRAISLLNSDLKNNTQISVEKSSPWPSFISSKENSNQPDISNNIHLKFRDEALILSTTPPTETALNSSTLFSTPVNKESPRAEISLDQRTPVQEQNFGGSAQKDSTQQQVQTRPQPRAKSFENFLDSNPDVRNIDFSTMSVTNGGISNTSTIGLSSSDNLSTSTMTSVIDTTNSTEVKSIAITSTISPAANSQESSLNEDLIGILSGVMDYLVSIAVPISIVLGIFLLLSIIIALCNLYVKRKKSKQFEVGDRFKFRYGSERRQFLKNSARPIILETDQKSLSRGGTPQHATSKPVPLSPKTKADYQKLAQIRAVETVENSAHVTTSFADDRSRANI